MTKKCVYFLAITISTCTFTMRNYCNTLTTHFHFKPTRAAIMYLSRTLTLTRSISSSAGEFFNTLNQILLLVLLYQVRHLASKVKKNGKENIKLRCFIAFHVSRSSRTGTVRFPAPPRRLLRLVLNGYHSAAAHGMPQNENL